MVKIIRNHEKLRLYFGTVKSATGGRHFMAWANSREHALDLVEAALTATEPVQGSVVGPLMSLRRRCEAWRLCRDEAWPEEGMNMNPDLSAVT